MQMYEINKKLCHVFSKESDRGLTVRQTRLTHGVELCINTLVASLLQAFYRAPLPMILIIQQHVASFVMTCLGKQHGVVVVVVHGVKGELQRVLSDNFILSTSLGAFEEMLKRVAQGLVGGEGDRHKGSRHLVDATRRRR